MAKAAADKSAAPAWTSATLPRLILIAGPEAALREEALERVKNSAAPAAPVTFHGPASLNESEALAPATVLDEVCTRSMFAADDELKLVLVRGADIFLAAHFRLFEEQLDAIPDSSTLIFECAGFGKLKTTNFYKKLIARNAVIECGTLFGEYGDTSAIELEITRRAQALGLRLNHGAMLALLARSAKSLGVIEEELGKLALTLKPAGQAGVDAQIVEVTEQHIDEFCARTGTSTAFQFVDAVLQGDARNALEILGALFERGIADSKKPGKLITQDDAIVMIVLGALTYKLSLLQDVRAAIDCGKSEYAVFGEFKLFGARKDDIQRLLRKHTDYSLRRSVEALFNAYLSLRRGGGSEPQAVLNELIFKFVRA